MEHFPTIQGEGFHTGKPAYFFRLGGCDVGCRWCDVKESWPIQGHPEMDVEYMASLVKQVAFEIAVITGGEPTLHHLERLTDTLHANGIRTHIETAGVHDLTGHWDWVTFSPKKFKEPVPGFAKLASELKVVVFHKSDFEFAEKHAAQVGEHCQLFLQPEWEKRESIMPLIVDYVCRNPKWRISLQTHKYLNIP